jgi:cyclic pyranopterin phosphate synthase
MHNRGMPTKVIPLTDFRLAAPRSRDTSVAVADDGAPLVDILARPLRDLRISVTDRCNFRCSYCMPKEVFDKNYRFLPHDSLLSFEEITRVAGIFAVQGVRKIRLTGGEPLLRKNLEVLVGMLSALRTPLGAPLDLTLTTNASMLARKAQALKDAGLQRVTVSLDALDDAIFRRMNDVDFPVIDVLKGIEAAQRVGLGPIKVNMVVKRGTNDSEIVPLARHFRNSGIVLRFIEYMDVGTTNQWRMDEVLPSAQVIEQLQAFHRLEPVRPNQTGETAKRWRYLDGAGEIGVISSVSQAFCSDCNRARLSTEGRLYLCLFAHQGHDLKSLLRSGADDAQLTSHLRDIWRGRGDRYSELRAAADSPDLTAHASANAMPVAVDAEQSRRVEMHYIGG